MSVKLMSKAWETDQKGNDLLVLLAMCDFASDEGILFPSLKTLAAKAKVATSTLSYILRAYEKIGVITRTQRQRENKSDTSTMYKINHFVIDSKAYKEAYQEARKYTNKSSQCEHPKNEKNIHNVNTQSHNVNTLNENCEHLEPSTLNHQDITITKEKNKKENDEVSEKEKITPADIIKTYREYVSNLNAKVKETQSLNALVLLPKNQQQELYQKIYDGIINYGLHSKAKDTNEQFLTNLHAFINNKVYEDFQVMPDIFANSSPQTKKEKSDQFIDDYFKGQETPVEEVEVIA